LGIKGGTVPGLDFKNAPKIMNALHNAVEQGLILSCHDLSEGGLALAIAEMSFSGDVGAEIDLRVVPLRGENKRNDTILFSESNTRFLVEVREQNADLFAALFQNLPTAVIGRTVKGKDLRIFSGERRLVDLPLSLLRKKWQRKVL
jgi:phosphoribosylformylglycinamidine synthase